LAVYVLVSVRGYIAIPGTRWVWTGVSDRQFHRDLATDVLVPIVGTSVAIILFQDAFELAPQDLRETSMTVLRLVLTALVVKTDERLSSEKLA